MNEDKAPSICLYSSLVVDHWGLWRHGKRSFFKMVFYRFNQLAQSLRVTPRQVLAVTKTTSESGAPRFVYKPLLTIQNVPATSGGAIAPSSSSSHHHIEIPKAWAGSENWTSWKDVPDEWIPTTSKRDPDNLIYAEPRYIALRKKQVFAQRPSARDTPVYLLNGTPDKIGFWFLVIATGLGLSWSFYEHYKNIYKKYYPDSNLFFFFWIQPTLSSAFDHENRFLKSVVKLFKE